MKGQFRQRRRSFGISLIALLAATGAADAQEAPIQNQDADASQSEAITEIVVTARKREEKIRDVPVAITALSGLELQSKNITQIIDLPAITPNFQFSNATVTPLLFIRGIGSGLNSSFEQSVGKFVDNVSYGRDQDGRIPLFDIEQLEVLKGPQVVAFGNSATAGALNVRTRRPGDRFAFNGSVAYESYNNETQLQGGLTLPLADWASFRVAGLYQNLDRGRLYNPAIGRREPTSENWAVRPTLRLEAAPGLTAILKFEYDHVRDYGNTIQPIGQPLNPAVPRFLEVDDPDIRITNTDKGLVSSPELSGITARLYQLDVNYEVLGGTFSSTTAYRKTRSSAQFGIDGLNDITFYYNALFQRYSQFSQEARFSGTYGDLDITAGGYYQRDRLYVDFLQDFQLAGLGFSGVAATPLGRLASLNQLARTLSAFVDTNYNFTPQLSLSLGLRYANNRKAAGQFLDAVSIPPNVGFDTSSSYLRSFLTPGLRPLLGPILGSAAHDFPFGTLRLAESHWQPQAIVQYKFAPRNMAYAKFVQGDKVGGFDYLYAGTVPAAARFRPERAQSFELGAKGLLLDGNLEYSVSAFRTTFTELQQSVFSNLVFVISNVGKSRSQGIEADFILHPVEGLQLRFGGSYLDAKYLDFQGAACNTAQNLVTPRGCFQDLSGTPVQYASKWSGVFGAEYKQPLGNDYLLTSGVSVLARTKYNPGAVNDPRMIQKGYALLDAHVDLRSENDGWTLSLFSRNLTNKQVLEYTTLVPGSGTAFGGSYSRGRQLGLRLSLNLP